MQEFIKFFVKNVHTLNLLKTKSNISFNILSNYIKQIEKQHKINFKVFFDSFQTSQEIRSSKKICYKRLQIVYKSIITKLYADQMEDDLITRTTKKSMLDKNNRIKIKHFAICLN